MEENTSVKVIPIIFKVYYKGEFVRSVEFRQESILIGRIVSADLQLKDESISRLHAVIEVSDSENVFLFDLGSSNGTQVNGTTLRETKIKNGDLIFVGNTTIMVTLGDELVDIATPQTPMPVISDEQLENQSLIPTRIIDTEADDSEAAVAKSFSSKEIESIKSEFPGRQTTFITESLTSGKSKDIMEVLMLWGDTIVDVKHFQKRKEITIGQSSKNDFHFGSASFPQKAPLVKYYNGKYCLMVSSNMSGELKKGNRMNKLSEMISADNVVPIEISGIKYYPLEIPKEAKGVVSVGNISFYIQFVRPSQKYKINYYKKLDKIFFLILIMSFLIHFGVIRYFPAKSQDLDLNARMKTPDRFTRLILYAPEKVRKLSEKGIALKTGKSGEPAENAYSEDKSATKGAASKVKKINYAGITGVLKELGSKGEFGNILGQASLSSELSGVMSALGSQAKGGAKKEHFKSEGQAGSGLATLRGISQPSGNVGVGTILVSPAEKKMQEYGVGAGSLAIATKGQASINIEREQTVIVGALTREEIEEVVKRYLPRLEYCYEQELMKDPKLQGKVEITWSIDPSGRVAKAFVKNTTMKNAAVEDCMVRAIARWVFPLPRGGGYVEVNYPFIFMKQ